VKAELESDWDQAYRLYIKTAESYLHLNRTTNDEGLRARCQANAGKALERAEKIRMKKKDLTPVVVDPFSVGSSYCSSRSRAICIDIFVPAEEEQFYVLKKSSIVNNLRFPLWVEPVTNSRLASAFEYVH
jgi:calpain-7